MADHPRLVRGITITRRQVGPGEIYYIVKDPRAGTYLRMGEVEVAVLRLLDGARSAAMVSEALARDLDHEVDEAVVEDFIETMRRRGLVESGSFDPEEFRREWIVQQRSRRRSLGKFLGSLTHLKLKLLNPQRLFTRLVGPLGFLWTPAFVIGSSVLMLVAAMMAVSYGESIAESFKLFYLSGTSSAGEFVSHAIVVYLSFFIVVAVHESAHGLTCTHFGGKVPEMGFILFYFQVPGFYCDITDAYSFESRSDRLWTTIAGGYSGLVLASMGVFVWWATPAGSLLNNSAIMMMLLGGPPLLILNWNPFIRLDGYYILMDLLEAPNLMKNSFGYLGYLFKFHVLRLDCDPPRVPRRLRKAYVAYGISALSVIGPLIAAMPLILYYTFRDVFGKGLAATLAAAIGIQLMKGPVVKATKTLRNAWAAHLGEPAAARQRGVSRAKVMLGIAAAGMVVLAAGPRFPVQVYSSGVMEPWERIDVRAGSAGFVPESSSFPRDGEIVERGAFLVRLENADIEARHEEARLRAAALGIDVSRLEALRQPALAAARRTEHRSALEERGILLERSNALTLEAPITGMVLTPRLKDTAGRYLKEGEVWCVIGTTRRLRVRATLGEADLGAIAPDSTVSIKSPHLPGSIFRGQVVSLPAGRRRSPPPVMQVAAAPEPAPPDPVQGSMDVEIEIDNASGLLHPGMGVHVRIAGERYSAAGHAARWARRLFKGKVWW